MQTEIERIIRMGQLISMLEYRIRQRDKINREELLLDRQPIGIPPIPEHRSIWNGREFISKNQVTEPQVLSDTADPAYSTEKQEQQQLSYFELIAKKNREIKEKQDAERKQNNNRTISRYVTTKPSSSRDPS